METGIWKLSEIVPAEYNPRVELKSGDTEYEALTNSISRFGLVEPLIVNKRNNILIGGHQRLNVLKEMGVEETEVIIVDLPEEQEKQLNVSLNKIEGDWDMYKLEEVLKEIDADDIAYTGFSEEEIDNIIGINRESEIEDIIQDTYITEPEEGNGSYTEGSDEPTEFDIYLSFPTRETAEKFLRKEGLSYEIPDKTRSITIHMGENDD